MEHIDLDNLEKQARTALGLSQSGEVAFALEAIPALIARVRLLERAAGAAAALLTHCAETGGKVTPEVAVLRDALKRAGTISPDWDGWFARKGEL